MRLDSFLVENNFYKSRNKAAEGINRGEVFVNGKPCLKSSTQVDNADVVSLERNEIPFVSLGGDKLKKAVIKFIPQIEGKHFIDVGASTGGFTDCLLRNGAAKVYCVDVAENLLDERIANDNRVVVMDKTNARYLTVEQIGERVDGIVVDCSFISLEYILPPLVPLLNESGYLLALIKPQFELQERLKLKNGILRDNSLRLKILRRIYDFSIKCGLSPQGIVDVTADKKKNVEYIIYLNRDMGSKSFESLVNELK